MNAEIDVELTNNDILELRLLRGKLESERDAEVYSAKKRVSETGNSLNYRTSDKERECVKGIEVLNRILKQV